MRQSNASSVAAIVPAAGAGTRLGGRIRKPLVPLQGRPLLVHTLQALQQSPVIRWIVVVVRADERADVQRLLTRYRITKALTPCRGGSSRSESVARGFAALPREAEWVLIHDGARPCVSPRLIQAAARAARRYGAVACGVPAMLTVKAVDGRGDVRSTLERDRLWLVQTPQVFRRALFAKALQQANQGLARFPDDASLVEEAGYRVRMIPGEALNLKVTTREDLLLAEAILRRRKVDG